MTVTEIERTYKNNGQHLEQCFRFTLTHEIVKADNKPATECGDVFDIQVKSAKATVCHGTDLKAYLEMDAAKRYAYITKNYVAYIMTKEMWFDFCTTFGYIAHESEKNGGAEKIRLKSESRMMIDWLETH